MTSPLAAGNRWRLRGLAVFTLGLVALGVEQAPALALINESSSLPKGVYLRHPGGEVRRGAIVAVPQPASADAYLGGLGMPPDVLLIKRVAAVGGDRVCRVGDRMWTPVAEVSVLMRDRRGAVLPAWPECRRLGPEEVFLLGDTPTSFDSRYFGPVRRTAIVGVFREAMTW